MENMVNMLEKLQQTYKGKKVFLTGHTGFKGSWLLKTLNMLGAGVMGYSLAPEDEQCLFNLIDGDIICNSIIADLRDRNSLTDAVKSFQPDFIFHLAAQPLVRLSYEIPADTFEVNVIGTANVLDALKTVNKRCQAVIITTDKVYYNNEWDYPYRENDRLGGYDPYSASKACAELVIDSYRNSFFNTKTYNQHQKTIGVARAGNVIGGGDWAKDRLIPDIVRALSRGEKIEIRNPSSVRPWQHVLEPVVGYLILGAKLEEDPIQYAEAYNFGPDFNDALEVNVMVDLAVKFWGKGEYYIKKDINQPHEAGLLKLDINKTIAKLGWRPRYNAETAIERTISWYKHYYNNIGRMAEFTEDQIKGFLEA